jgi:hypothetical protein
MLKNYTKKTSIFIFIILILNLIFLSNSSAQELQEDENGFIDVIEMEFIPQLQNPETLEFEYALKVKTLIDTQRLRIKWEIVNRLMRPAEETILSDAIQINKNEEVYLIKKFTPLVAGFEEIRVTAIAFGERDDYISFAETTFFINEDLKIAPDDSDFKNAENIMSTLKGAKTIGIAVDGIFLGLLGLFRFKKWLDSD